MSRETHANVIAHIDGQTGRSCYAVWVGFGYVNNDKRRLLGARLLNIYKNKRDAERAAKQHIKSTSPPPESSSFRR